MHDGGSELDSAVGAVGVGARRSAIADGARGHGGPAATGPRANGRPAVVSPGKPAVRGKFLFAGDRKLFLRGVTYGTFRRGPDGSDYRDPATVERDFHEMAARGINAVRTYTVPPRSLLDAAARHGLYVLVGLPWEQHVTFLDERGRARSIERRVREGVQACAGHPAVLAYAVGNEIPTGIVRWSGPRPIERFIEGLHRAAKAEDPEALVTYVNYPSTEYLRLSFLDFLCFNVYLEEQPRLQAYLARLQTLAGDRPLVMAEIGLDSRRHGMHAQARALAWQVQTSFSAGCAGTFVFAWTDEWHRGGNDVDDWDFGLTDRAGTPKPALAAVARIYERVPFRTGGRRPRVSVVVCSHNGARTLPECLEGVDALDYPNFEIILVDDGSTDATAAIGQEHGVRVISTPNRGLGAARNTGLERATGEIVAYLDDDARPDRDWLTYLVAGFGDRRHVAVGGPNVAPDDDRPVARCVARAPGGPVHVLLSDDEAEHLPGCNMAFRRDALLACGGFDPQFCVAGDDVDICWQMRRDGGTIGFSPAAVVWHRRRSSIHAYLRQQAGYGRSEALLERKWPERYNATGHARWSGRLYGPESPRASRLGTRRVGYGTWGREPFQSIYEPAGGVAASLLRMPEWYLLIALLTLLGAGGLLWAPLLPAIALAVPALLASLADAGVEGLRARGAGGRPLPVRERALIAALHALQPAARLWGRVEFGLAPWRNRGGHAVALPWPRIRTVWSETWSDPYERLVALESALRRGGSAVRRGGRFDRWDLEVSGLLAGVRTRMVAEEHGGGRQLVRFRTWPRLGGAAARILGGLVAAALLATASGHEAFAATVIALAGLVAARGLFESAAATRQLLRRLDDHRRGDEPAALPAGEQA